MVMPLGFESVQIKESMRTKFEQSKRLMILLFQKKGNSQQENWLENNPSLESLNPSETQAPISPPSYALSFQYNVPSFSPAFTCLSLLFVTKLFRISLYGLKIYGLS